MNDPSTSAIVGREREQGELRDLLAQATAGQASLVLLGGEAGIGKTTLVRWLMEVASEQGALVLSGGCYDLTTTPPYGPWIEIVARLRQGEGQATQDEALTSGGQGARFAAFRALLLDIAARRPLVVVLEDLHWADPASLDLLRFLTRQPAAPPALIVATYRDDELEPGHPLFQVLPLLAKEARAERIDLRRLDARGIDALIARYRLPRADERRLATYLARLSDGNLLFLSELLRTLESEGSLHLGECGWTLLALRESLVPPLVQQVILRRLERLGTATHRALAIASVIGQIVPLELWSVVSDLDDEQLVEMSETALAAHVLVDGTDGASLAFSHALVRAAIYERLSLPRRRLWHRKVAETLAAQPYPAPDSVAYHFQQAGDARAFDWHVRAGMQAGDDASISAGHHFEAALAWLGNDPTRNPERAALLHLAGRYLAHSGDAHAITYLEDAEALFRAAGEHALAAYTSGARGRMRCRTGDLHQGLPDIERAVATIDALLGTWQPADDYTPLFQRLYPATADAPVATSQLTVNLQRGWLANWLANCGRYRETVSISQALLAELYRAADQAPIETPEAYNCRLGLAQSFGALGQPDDLRREMLRLRADATPPPEYPVIEQSFWLELHLVTLPYHTDNLAARARLVADAQRSWARCRESAITTAGDGAPSELQVDLLEGRWQKARQLASDHIPAPWLNHLQEGIVTLGILDRLQGRRDAAWDRVAQVLPHGPATEPGECFFMVVINAIALAADLALDAGDLPLARRWLATHDRWLEWSEARLWQADNLLLWARADELAGDLALARFHAETALALASKPRMPLRRVAAWRVLGRLDTQAGQLQSAASYLEQALTLATACAAPFERALTLLALAELRDALGERDAARAALTEARSICLALDALPTLEQVAALEAAFTQVAVAPVAYPDGLTPREVEVLRLIAAGRSNREIAETLFLSHRTVERHVTNIYLKIDAHNKADATAYALRHGLA